MGDGWRRRTRAVLLPLLLVVSMSVGACSAAPEAETTTPRIVIGSDGRDVSRLLAYVYAHALAAAGAHTVVAEAAAAPDAVVDELATAKVDLYAGFTGELLGVLDPSATDTTEDEVYRALSRSLPQWLALADPVSARLPDARGARAQNVVPLVRSQPLTERLDNALGTVAGDLTTADLADMVDQVRAGRPVDQVSAQWVAGRGF